MVKICGGATVAFVSFAASCSATTETLDGIGVTESAAILGEAGNNECAFNCHFS